MAMRILKVAVAPDGTLRLTEVQRVGVAACSLVAAGVANGVVVVGVAACGLVAAGVANGVVGGLVVAAGVTECDAVSLVVVGAAAGGLCCQLWADLCILLESVHCHDCAGPFSVGVARWLFHVWSVVHHVRVVGGVPFDCIESGEYENNGDDRLGLGTGCCSFRCHEGRGVHESLSAGGPLRDIARGSGSGCSV